MFQVVEIDPSKQGGLFYLPALNQNFFPQSEKSNVIPTVIGNFLPTDTSLQKSYSKLLRTPPTPEQAQHYRNLADAEAKAVMKIVSSHYGTRTERFIAKAAKRIPALSKIKSISDLAKRVESGKSYLKNIGALPERTRADALKGKLQRVPLNALADLTHRSLLERRLYYHPLTLIAFKTLEKEGFKPLTREHYALFRKILSEHDHTAPTYHDYYASVRPPNPDSKVTERTTLIGATGLYTWVANNLAARIDCLGSYTSNNFRLLAAAARMQMVSFVDADGWMHSNRGGIEAQKDKRQAALVEVDNDPLLGEAEYNVEIAELGTTIADFVKQRARRLIGVTIKCEDPEDAEKCVRYFLKNGVTTFRLYDAGSTNNLEISTKRVMSAINEYCEQTGSRQEEMTIFAGQVTGVEQGRRLVEAGANSIIGGIAEGAFCSTGRKTSVIPNNLKNVMRLADGCRSVPVGSDGGVDGNYPCVAAAGLPFKISASLGKDTIEGASLFGVLRKDAAGKLCYMWTHGGEASASTKLAGGSTDYAGAALNVEGESGIGKVRMSDIDNPDATPTLYFKYRKDVVEAVSKAIRFTRNQSWLELVHTTDETVLEPTNNQVNNIHPFDRSKNDTSSPQLGQRLENFLRDILLHIKFLR